MFKNEGNVNQKSKYRESIEKIIFYCKSKINTYSSLLFISYKSFSIEISRFINKFISTQKPFLLLLITTVLLSSDLMNLIVEFKVIMLFDDFEKHIFFDLIFFVILTISIAQKVLQVRKKKHFLDKIELIKVLTSSIVYFFCIRKNEYIRFERSVLIDSLMYVDYIFIIICVNSIKYNITETKISSENLLYSDNPVENSKKIHPESALGQNLSKHIATINFEGSFAIGILGNWGSGKSTLILELEKYFKENKKDDFKVIEFNTWRFENAADLQLSFLKTLQLAMSTVDPRIKRPFGEYLNSIIKVDAGYVSKAASLFQNAFYSYNKEENLFETLNQAIMRSGMRYLVLMDDMDRLSNKEILSTFKLIRNMANFGHVIFVCAFDLNYLINTLNKESSIAFDEKYLEKIFNLSVFLPVNHQKKTRDFLNDKLIINNPLLHGKNQILKEEFENFIQFICTASQFEIIAQKPIRKENSISQIVFKEYRNIIRFSNSVIFSLNQIDPNEIDISDFLLLEIIKLSFPSYWKQMADQNLGIYTVVMENNSTVVSVNFKYLEEQKQISTEKEKIDFEIFKSICERAFDKKRPRILKSRACFYKHNLPIYFHSSYFGLFSIKEYYNLWHTNPSQIIESISQIEETDNIENFCQILNREITTELSNEVVFKKYLIKVWLASNNHIKYFKENALTEDLFTFTLSEDKNTYSNVLKAILQFESIRPLYRFQLFKNLINLIHYYSQELREIILEINHHQLQAWDLTFQNEEEFSMDAFKSLRCIISEITELKQIILADGARFRGKDYIERFFIEYTRLFFRIGELGAEDSYFVGEPYLEQFFSPLSIEKDQFNIILEMHIQIQFSSEEANWLRWFQQKYLALKHNKFKPIKFSSEDLEIFHKNSVSEI